MFALFQAEGCMQPLPAIILCLALALYVLLGINVGRARAKFQIAAPATTGNPVFERVFRVHQNTLESLVVFVPVFFLFCRYVSSLWGSVIGAAWIIGRVLYAAAYYRDARRSLGFGIASIATLILLLGSVIGAVSAWIRA